MTMHALKPNGVVRKSPRHLHALDNEIHFHEPKKVMRTHTSDEGRDPDTTMASLFCYTCETPRLHSFQGRTLVKSPLGIALYTELNYKCEDCGVERVWGTEEPSV